ncbi:PRTRC system protein E [Pseudomonas violetae]|uniref:PRTRC system protein E n=1 Tax=Pseudomonas violetae TaxID=2915813 RepID=A0ABT0ESQ1_9PSED|nr:PRTRC system protein E [Pseudomonas violetae]MCK1788654.1 PRTRC system protein E [Pseudomonas violetae]
MSHQTFLQAISAVLIPGMSATVEVQGLPNGEIKLIYTPNIGTTPDNASDAIVQLRAAISKPMIIAGAPAEIEEAFGKLIAQKAQVVGRGLSALDEIERLAGAAIAEAKAKPVGAAASTTVNPVDEDEDEPSDDEPAATPAIPPVNSRTAF